jgi:hypothetical protein
MIRSFLLAAMPAAPRVPRGRIRAGLADPRDPAGRAFADDGLGHGEEGRIESSALKQRSGRATGTPETPEAVRAVHAAKARLIGGKGARAGR